MCAWDWLAARADRRPVARHVKAGVPFIHPGKEYPMTQPIGGPTRSVSWTDLNLGDGNDDVRISRASGADGLKGLFEVSINGKVQLMTKEQLEHTRFNLNGGNDTLVVHPEVDARITAFGGSGDDLLLGGAGDDHLYGGAGKDIIKGRGGADVIHGGDDHDRDTLEGGTGPDTVIHGPEDTVIGDARAVVPARERDTLIDAMHERARGR
jgi:hypothetical protein